MNVAVVNAGPGVTCPIATASNSCGSVSQPWTFDEISAEQGEQDVAAAEEFEGDAVMGVT